MSNEVPRMWENDSRLGVILPELQEPQPPEEWYHKAVKEVQETEMKFSDRIRMRLNGYIYIGHRKKPEWKTPLPFYLFKCPVHGMVQSYPYGYNQKLLCPYCSVFEAIKRKDET